VIKKLTASHLVYHTKLQTKRNDDNREQNKKMIVRSPKCS